MKQFNDFIDANRQKGSTTELVWAAVRADGYLVVWNERAKQAVLKQFTTLKEENVFTVSDIKNERWRGREARPVFVDAACFCVESPEDPIMAFTLREIIRRAKLVASSQVTKESTE